MQKNRWEWATRNTWIISKSSLNLKTACSETYKTCFLTMFRWWVPFFRNLTLSIFYTLSTYCQEEQLHYIYIYNLVKGLTVPNITALISLYHIGTFYIDYLTGSTSCGKLLFKNYDWHKLNIYTLFHFQQRKELCYSCSLYFFLKIPAEVPVGFSNFCNVSDNIWVTYWFLLSRENVTISFYRQREMSFLANLVR